MALDTQCLIQMPGQSRKSELGALEQWLKRVCGNMVKCGLRARAGVQAWDLSTDPLVYTWLEIREGLWSLLCAGVTKNTLEA